ncbi:MAG: hypothetical protein RIS44_1048 [Pseudomonadota bacterium]|jgi:hypothetical protein
MVTKASLLKLDEMEAIAKKATHDALKAYPRPENFENLTLGSGITDSEGIFELYIAGERPRDAKVISCAKVNRSTGEVKVQVFLPLI